MTTLRVVKPLDVIEYIPTSILSHGVDFPLDSFPFQQLEKTLSHGVVVAVTSTAHAGDQIVGL